MKYFRRFLGLICLIVLLVSPFLTILAQSNVLDGYNQVVNKGGSNKNEEDGVIVSKTISESGLENYFDIKLKVQTMSKAEDQDLAVVIVMDISNTMNTKMKDDITRLAAAQEASKNFIDGFYKNAASSNGAERKIGFVAFNTDAHTIFGLQYCNNASMATSLKNTLVNETNKIADAPGYKDAHSRFTNIGAGLKMANDMLNSAGIANKYIVFLSDGFPTTYIKSDYSGYDPYDSNSSSSVEGRFHDDVLGRSCKYGTSYSDRAAIKAREMATDIKDSGTKIYSIGVDVEGQTIQKYITQSENANGYSVVDRTGTNYEIGDASSSEAYKNWLRNKIGSGYYWDVTDSNALTTAFNEIFEKIMYLSEASWVAEDPMNVSGEIKNIEFVGIYDDSKTNLYEKIERGTGISNTASYGLNTDKINWDLKKSNCTEIKDGNVTYYVYELNYRIRLQNELDNFDVSEIYKTNGTTTLSYVVSKNGTTSELKNIDFPIPEIVGYLGSLEFTKISKLNNINLSGAKFKLEHDDNCPCHNEIKRASDDDLYFEAISDENGSVKFYNIPSGHKYKLVELEAPLKHILNNTEYNVEVAYGNTTHNIENNQIINDYEKSNLNISKEVQGNISDSGVFKFKLIINYNNIPISGSFKYKLGDKEGSLSFDENGSTTINLKHNETIYIYDLPYGLSYNLTELETNGYEVNYKINDDKVKNGSSLSGNLELGNTNNIKFINIGGYILPETGSSGMLILVITGILLTGGSVINICYMYFKKRRLS